MKKLILAIAAVWCAVSAAQVPGTGAYNHATLDSPGFDQVNVGNLNTRFTIPIVSKQGRGLPFNYVIQYEGLVWQPVNNGTTTTWVPNTNWGFNGQLNGNGLIGYLTYNTSTIRCGGAIQQGQPLYYETYTSAYIYHDPFGAIHQFNYSTNSGCAGGYNPTGPSTTGDGSSTDGSGYTLVNGSSVKTSSGIMISPSGAGGSGGSSETDANGNEITFNGSGAFTDTTGTNELTISGSSPVQFTYPVTLQANSASSASASLSYKSYTVRSNFGCSGVVEYGSTTAALVDHITLADGETYSFTYETTPGVSGAVTGRLASITLPTGGVIQYAYQNGSNGINCSDGTTEGLVRTTTDGTRTYSRPAPGQPANTTLLTDERGKQSYWWFSTDSLGQYEATHRRAHDGTASNTNLLQEDITCYNNAAQSNGTCDGQAVTDPVTEADTSTTYNYVATPATTKNTYDSATGTYLTQSSVYSGSTLLMNTINTYTTNSSQVTELTSVKTTDGSGNTVSYTGYSYDGATPKPTSSLPQRGTPYSYPGNLTSVQVSIDGTTTNTLNTTTAYYDTGMPVSTTDPGGSTTTYGYESTGTFQTSITYPTPSSNVGLSTSAIYDTASGAIKSSTGMNSGQTFTVTQYDPLLRPTAVTDPEGGQSIATYAPTHVSNKSQMNSSQWKDQETFLDPYGRLSRVAVQSSSGWYLTDYCFANGVLQYKSVPYLGSSDYPSSFNCSTSNATQYTYDGLGRTTVAAKPDGDTITKTYNGRAVQIADNNGTTKIIQHDLLGRNSGVCEIASSSDAAGNAPSPCSGFDISGSGFATAYSYNLAGHTTTVTEGAQTRTFITDAAGRTTSVTEPESGTATYSYAYRSSGLLNTYGLQVVRTRPRANQTNPSVTTTTTSQYDRMGRLTDVMYIDGTPSKNFAYDAPNHSNQGAIIGQLVGLSTLNSSNQAINARGYFYDIMGRVTGTDECLPDWCNSGVGDAYQWYGYDLASNMTSQSYATDQGGSGVTTLTYTYNTAGQMLTVSGGINNATNQPAIYTATANSMQPGGPQFITFANNVTSYARYDAMNRLSGKWLCGLPGGYNCPNSTYYYGYAMSQVGSQVKWAIDTAVSERGTQFGYDQFGNLASSSTLSGSTPLNFSAAYDRYGNRWSETVSNTPSGTGPSQTASYSLIHNQLNNGTALYDAVGNVTSITISGVTHIYQYDAENNLINIDGGSTASYTYTALNERDKVVDANGTNRVGFDIFSRRSTSWQDGYAYVKLHQYYSDQGPLAFFSNAEGVLYFEHQDWLGTERMRTDNSGNIQSTYASLPFGEPNAATGTGDFDLHHFTGLDEDNSFSASSLGLSHATFRDYNSIQGRWMSPDPYSGSYRGGNPQTFNRYSYVLNDALALTDPLGLDTSITSTIYDSSGNVLGISNSYQTDVNATDPGYGYVGGSPSGAITGIPLIFVGGGHGGGGTGQQPAPSKPAAPPAPQYPPCGSGYGGGGCVPAPPTCKALDQTGDALKAVGTTAALYKVLGLATVAAGGSDLPYTGAAAIGGGAAAGIGTLFGLAAKYHIGCTQ